MQLSVSNVFAEIAFLFTAMIYLELIKAGYASCSFFISSSVSVISLSTTLSVPVISVSCPNSLIFVFMKNVLQLVQVGCLKPVAY